jgi:hypothetical protein
LSWFRRRPMVKEPVQKTPYRARTSLPLTPPQQDEKQQQGLENGIARPENRTNSNLYNKGS